MRPPHLVCQDVDINSAGTRDRRLLFCAVAGLMAVAAMWRAYFVADDTRAAEAFEHASGRVGADQALLGYGLAHLDD